MRQEWWARRVGNARAKCAEGSERGAAIVEAAIIVPLMILLTFGAIEFGFAFRDSAQVSSSTRAGARIASTLTASPSFAANANAAVSDELKDMDGTDPQTLFIYKANSNGDPSGGFSTGGCDDCFVYTWNASARRWTGPTNSAGSRWTETEQRDQACVTGGTLPAVGIRVQAKHPFITGLFGKNLTFTHKTVIRMEPLAPSQCS